MDELVKRALVVDDDPQIRELLKTLLERENIQTYAASSAEEALEILKKCGDYQIQVLLTDLSLPGMDGMSLCRRVRRTEPLIVTIALTGFSDLYTLCECREIGFDDYLSKPISMRVLNAALVGAFKRVRYWEAMVKRSMWERDKKKPDGSGIT